MFFINAFPPNDKNENHKRGGPLLRADIDRIRSEAVYFAHTLFTVGTKRLDPWVIAQAIMASDRKFSPLIAVNPIHQHPLAVAKKLATLSQVYENPIAVNFISGSFYREHVALYDESGFEEKTERLYDFISAIRKMLNERKPVHHDGKFFPLKGVELAPEFINRNFRYFVSGGLSDRLAGFEDTYFVKSMRPLSLTEKIASPRSGFLAGICARKTREEAISEIQRIFPEDKVGKRMHEMSLSNVMTPWNQFLRDYSLREPDYHYFLKPLENFWSPAPYIVGSYEEVAGVLKAYGEKGVEFFILDFHPGDLEHVKKVIAISG